MAEKKLHALLQLELWGDAPPSKLHIYKSFEKADEHLRKAAGKLYPEECRSYEFTARWDDDFSSGGHITIERDDTRSKNIIIDNLASGLRRNLLLWSDGSTKNDLLQMVSQPQWQVDRLFLDQDLQDESLKMLLECDGFDHEKIEQDYMMMHRVVLLIDAYHPLLMKIFPNAVQKLQLARSMPNRTDAYKKEVEHEFMLLSSDAIHAAMTDNEPFFERAWTKLVSLCVEISDEARYADERVTNVGKKLYYLADDDAILLKKSLNGLSGPLSNESEYEFWIRDKAVAAALTTSKEDHSNYMAIFRSLYARHYISNDRKWSRLALSQKAAQILLSKYKLQRGVVAGIISDSDPMAEQNPTNTQEVNSRK